MPNNWGQDSLEKLVNFLLEYNGESYKSPKSGDVDRLVSFISDNESLDRYHVLFAKNMVKVGRRLSQKGVRFRDNTIYRLYNYAASAITRIPGNMGGELGELYNGIRSLDYDNQFGLLSHLERDAGILAHIYGKKQRPGTKWEWFSRSYEHYNRSIGCNLARENLSITDLMYLINTQRERIDLATDIISLPAAKSHNWVYDSMFSEIEESTLEFYKGNFHLLPQKDIKEMIRSYNNFLVKLYEVTGKKRQNLSKAISYAHSLLTA